MSALAPFLSGVAQGCWGLSSSQGLSTAACGAPGPSTLLESVGRLTKGHHSLSPKRYKPPGKEAAWWAGGGGEGGYGA